MGVCWASQEKQELKRLREKADVVAQAKRTQLTADETERAHMEKRDVLVAQARLLVNTDKKRAVSLFRRAKHHGAMAAQAGIQSLQLSTWIAQTDQATLQREVLASAKHMNEFSKTYGLKTIQTEDIMEDRRDAEIEAGEIRDIMESGFTAPFVELDDDDLISELMQEPDATGSTLFQEETKSVLSMASPHSTQTHKPVSSTRLVNPGSAVSDTDDITAILGSVSQPYKLSDGNIYKYETQL